MGFFGLSLLQNRYPALHGLRFVAILSVLQVHVTIVLGGFRLLRHPGISYLSQAVWFGMDLFFVLSGFLIGSMLLHQRGAGMGRFWLRRAFRTFPLYYVVLTAQLVLATRQIWTTRSLLSEYLYLTNYADESKVLMTWAWSLCVEEHFYLVVPILVFGLSRLTAPSARLGFLVGLWATAPLIRLYVVVSHVGAWTPTAMMAQVYTRTHTRFDALVAGLVLAHLVHHHEAALRGWFARRSVRLLAGGVVAGCLAFLLQPPQPPMSSPLWNVLAWGTVTSVMYVALVLLLLFHEGPVSRFLSLRPFMWAATLGYGVYLVHMPLMVRVVAPMSARLLRLQWSIGAVWWASLALLLLVSLVVAYVLHLAVEKPSLALRDRLAP